MGIDVLFAGIPVEELEPASTGTSASSAIPPTIGRGGQLRGLKAIPVRSFGKK